MPQEFIKILNMHVKHNKSIWTIDFGLQSIHFYITVVLFYLRSIEKNACGNIDTWADQVVPYKLLSQSSILKFFFNTFASWSQYYRKYLDNGYMKVYRPKSIGRGDTSTTISESNRPFQIDSLFLVHGLTGFWAIGKEK